MIKDYQNIVLEATDGNKYSIADFKGKKLVLYFYPKDNTPGCTIESKDFTCLSDNFKAKGYQVIGVSKDTLKSHYKFIDTQELNLLLLADPNKELIEAFDILKEKSMFGKKYMGVVRSTFIIDENGKVVKEYRNIKAANHAQTVLDEL